MVTSLSLPVWSGTTSVGNEQAGQQDNIPVRDPPMWPQDSRRYQYPPLPGAAVRGLDMSITRQLDTKTPRLTIVFLLQILVKYWILPNYVLRGRGTYRSSVGIEQL